MIVQRSAVNQRAYLALFILSCVVVFLWLVHLLLSPGPIMSRWPIATSSSAAQISLSSLKIAVVEQEVFHMEVLGAVLSDLTRLGVKPHVYRAEPYGYRFAEVLERFFPYGYEHIVKDQDSGVFQPGPLEDAIIAGEYDVVVLNSCQWAIWWDTYVFRALNASSTTQVVCILHTPNEEGIGGAKKQIGQLGAQGRLTALTLSHHTSAATVKLFDQWAKDDKDPSWDQIPLYHFFPIFPAIAAPHAVRKSRIPSKFVIQGSIDTLRRDYDGLIAELLSMIKADPHAWGYQQESDDSAFIPLKKPAHGTVPSPFTLHLVGHSIREPEIPQEMQNVVHIRDSPDFAEFYDTLSEMDALIPAFSNEEYLTTVSSSSMPAAIMSRTPVLASVAHMRSYRSLASPAAIVRPNSMSDAQAISLLRQGKDPMQGMATSGDGITYSSFSNWDDYIDSILEENDRTWRAILSRGAARRQRTS